MPLWLLLPLDALLIVAGWRHQSVRPERRRNTNRGNR